MYRLRSTDDLENFKLFKATPNTAYLTDLFCEFWGPVLGEYGHDGQGYTALFVDGSASFVSDGSGWLGALALSNPIWIWTSNTEAGFKWLQDNR